MNIENAMRKRTSVHLMMVIKNCLWQMVDLRKAVLFPAGHCQKLSPMQTSDTSQAEFQPEQNLSSGFTK